MNVIFWHICGLDDFKKIINEQYQTIIKSGLINNITKIFISYVGDNEKDLDTFLSQNEKLTLAVYNKDISQFERPCLHFMYDWCQSHHANILYIHSKGIRWLVDGGRYKNILEWRRMMEYFLIENYKVCLNKLINFDCIGCNFINPPDNLIYKINNEKHNAHFSGNFWWSKSSWIRKLPSRIIPNISSLDIYETKSYLLTERWILQPYPNVKIYEIYHDKDRCHYYDFSPLNYRDTNLYENKLNKYR